MTQPSLDFTLTPPAPTAASPVAVERQRLNANARRVLAYLQSHDWATNVELCDPAVGGMRAVGARMPELRAEGWQFEKQHVSGGLWRYRLVGRKQFDA